MSHINSKLLLLCATTVAFVDCSNTAINKKIDMEAKQETEVHSRADLNEKANDLIKTTPGLSDDQRAHLTTLRETTYADLDRTNQKSIKLRAVLIKALVTKDDNEQEVSQLKDRIKSLEDHRIVILFDAISKTNTILGHLDSEKRAQMMNNVFDRGSNRE